MENINCFSANIFYIKSFADFRGLLEKNLALVKYLDKI